ncbi:hypothetical protein NKH16_20200 [Mesorhizobium sp. M1307]|uniref:hypothetical protein n=1 Tax=Mesorhizobium sp. M1307 TaxID=2957079 RepID=UPI003336348D
MSKIKHAREAIDVLARDMREYGLHPAWSQRLRGILADFLTPNPMLPRAPRSETNNVKLTQELATMIRSYKQDNPEARQRDMSAIFRIDQAHVSRVLRGVVFPAVAA